MDRLTFVHDICHIRENQAYAWRSSAWHQKGIEKTEELTNGYTHTVFSSRLFTWRRHYTKNSVSPKPLLPPPAWITIDEWVPGIWPLIKDRASWICTYNSSHHGIAHIKKGEDITSTWSTHAKRHLKSFRKAGCTVRQGIFEDIERDILRSQVPRSISLALTRMIAHRLAHDPAHIDIFVAENKERKRIACLVSANDDKSKESMYLLGYFLPEAAKLQPMTGLVDAWLSLLQKHAYHSANFGLMIGPRTSRFDPWWGLSNFKTHFGITRVHLPPTFWKISTSLRK